MAVEALVLLALIVGGAATTWCCGLRGWGVLPLGFITGCALYLLAGVLVLALPLPTEPLFALVPVCAVPLALFLSMTRLRFRPPWGLWSGALVAAIALPALVRGLSLYKWHSDSIEYINGAELLNNGAFETAPSPYLLIKRLFGVPWLQSLGALNGEPFVHAVLPALALATLGSVAWFVLEGRPRRASVAAAVVAAIGAVLLLATSNRFIFHAFYINGHLLLGALILVAVGSCWLLVSKPEISATPLLTMGAIVLAAIPSIRPEGPILALLAIAPFLMSTAVPRSHRVVLAAGLGAGVLLWNSWVAVSLLENGFSALGVITQVVVLGVLLVVLLADCFLPWTAKAARPLIRGMEIVAWPALALLYFYDPYVTSESVTALGVNAYGDAAHWGASLWVYTALILLCVVALRLPGLGVLRFYVTTFIPVAMALAIGRGAPYRPGPFDSLARMLMQWLPLATLYIVVALAYGEPRRWVSGLWKKAIPRG